MLVCCEKSECTKHLKMYNNILAFLFEKTVHKIHKISSQFHLLKYILYVSKHMHKILQENKISGY